MFSEVWDKCECKMTSSTRERHRIHHDSHSRSVRESRDSLTSIKHVVSDVCACMGGRGEGGSCQHWMFMVWDMMCYVARMKFQPEWASAAAIVEWAEGSSSSRPVQQADICLCMAQWVRSHTVVADQYSKQTDACAWPQWVPYLMMVENFHVIDPCFLLFHVPLDPYFMTNSFLFEPLFLQKKSGCHYYIYWTSSWSNFSSDSFDAFCIIVLLDFQTNWLPFSLFLDFS